MKKTRKRNGCGIGRKEGRREGESGKAKDDEEKIWKERQKHTKERMRENKKGKKHGENR